MKRSPQSEAGDRVDATSLGETATVTLKVPFHHCDPLFVVWHGRYFEYLEAARAALFAGRGLDVTNVRDLGYKMFVTDARCRYLAPLTHGDEVSVTARLVEVTPLVRVAYSVKNLTSGRKSARASTALATTDATGKLLETPREIIERLQT